MLNFFPMIIQTIRRDVVLTIATMGLMLGGCASSAPPPPSYPIHHTFQQSNKKILLKENWVVLSPVMHQLQSALDNQHWDALSYWIARAKAQPELTPTEQVMVWLAHARWHLSQSQDLQADKLLSRHLPSPQWPDFLITQYWQLKALWAENTHRLLPLAQAHHHLSQHCPDVAEEHHWALYHALQQLPVTRLKQLISRRYTDKHWGGWVELALLSHTPELSFERARQRWQQNHRHHPAYDWTRPQSAVITPDTSLSIGILLPLSGSHQAAGKAIQSGWLTHYYHYFQHVDEDAFSVHFYDTQSTLKGTQQALKQMALDQVNSVVGPLIKAHVPIVSQWAQQHQTPLLLLNESPERQQARFIRSIDLSPEYRARTLANHLNARGDQEVLVIAGDSPAYRRALTAFEQYFHGHIRDRVFLSSSDSWGVEIQQLLQITDSQQRHEQLQTWMKRRVSSHPRIRADQTKIVLFLETAQARQIKPLLSFYYADDIPLISDGDVFTGMPAPNQDRDLDGILLADWPIFFATHPSALMLLFQTQPALYQGNPRLTLLGAEAFEQVTQTAHLLRYPYLGRLTLSGFYHYHPDGHWRRLLKWGEFQAGRPKALEKL